MSLLWFLKIFSSSTDVVFECFMAVLFASMMQLFDPTVGQTTRSLPVPYFWFLLLVKQLGFLGHLALDLSLRPARAWSSLP